MVSSGLVAMIENCRPARIAPADRSGQTWGYFSIFSDRPQSGAVRRTPGRRSGEGIPAMAGGVENWVKQMAHFVPKHSFRFVSCPFFTM